VYALHAQVVRLRLDECSLHGSNCVLSVQEAPYVGKQCRVQR